MGDMFDIETVQQCMGATLNFCQIPLSVLRNVDFRFSGRDPSTVGVPPSDCTYNEVIELADGRHVRMLALGAPALFSSDEPSSFSQDVKHYSRKVKPENLHNLFGGGLNLAHALAIMANDSRILANELQKKAYKSSEEAVKAAATGLNQLVGSNRYTGIVSVMKEFLTAAGFPVVSEDRVKMIITNIIAQSDSVFLHDMLSKAAGVGAVCFSLAGFGAKIGQWLGFSITNAVPIGCATAAVVLGAFAVYERIAACSTAEKQMELMKIFNYGNMFMQLRARITNQVFDKQNICLLVFDEMMDMKAAWESQSKLSQFFKSPKDVFSNPSYGNKGALCMFVHRKNCSNDLAPPFKGYRRTADGKDLREYYMTIFNNIDSQEEDEQLVKTQRILDAGMPAIEPGKPGSGPAGEGPGKLGGNPTVEGPGKPDGDPTVKGPGKKDGVKPIRKRVDHQKGGKKEGKNTKALKQKALSKRAKKQSSRAVATLSKRYRKSVKKR